MYMLCRCSINVIQEGFQMLSKATALKIRYLVHPSCTVQYEVPGTRFLVVYVPGTEKHGLYNHSSEKLLRILHESDFTFSFVPFFGSVHLHGTCPCCLTVRPFDFLS